MSEHIATCNLRRTHFTAEGRTQTVTAMTSAASPFIQSMRGGGEVQYIESSIEKWKPLSNQTITSYLLILISICQCTVQPLVVYLVLNGR